MARRNYAFDLAATIVSEKEFSDLTVAELCAAVRARLNILEESGAGGRGAFSCFDSFCVERDEGANCKCDLCGGGEDEDE